MFGKASFTEDHADYVNCPMDEPAFETLLNELLRAERMSLNKADIELLDSKIEALGDKTKTARYRELRKTTRAPSTIPHRCKQRALSMKSTASSVSNSG